jgi:hypothetical protein
MSGSHPMRTQIDHFSCYIYPLPPQSRFHVPTCCDGERWGKNTSCAIRIFPKPWEHAPPGATI